MIYIVLLIFVIVVCVVLSYKKENYDQIGTVSDSNVSPMSLDDYNCYDYVKKEFGWNVDSYSQGELKVLGTFRTGIRKSYQTKGIEQQYTQACILPKEHSFIFSDSQDNKINIGPHVLNMNGNNETPSGYKIDFSQTSGDYNYSKEASFRDLLNTGYDIMAKDFLSVIQTLSNQVYAPNTGLSNIHVMLQTDITNARNSLQSEIKNYKKICFPDPQRFTFLCGSQDQLTSLESCCPKDNPCADAENELAAINNRIALNNENKQYMEFYTNNMNSLLPDLDRDIATIEKYISDVNNMIV